MTSFIIAAFAFLYFLSLAGPAYAYLDPGTGSMIIQLVIGAVAGALVTLRLFWGKIKALFNRSEAGDKD